MSLVCWRCAKCFFSFLTLVAARVFAFMSGPPDYGAGQLDTKRYGEQYASKGEDADRALLPEQTPFYKDLVILLPLSTFSIASFGKCEH